MAKKMTMRAYEKSAADRKADKSSKFKEGSKKEMAQDRRELSKLNRKK